MSESDHLAGPGGLDYRIGTYASFLVAMQRAAKGNLQLSPHSLQCQGDFAGALISGWAKVCDVLTFYQERIANEGYLPTAVEPASICLLAAEIGEHRKPAVGARTSLALQLIDATGQPASLYVNPGPSLAVQNASASPNVPPVIFECAEGRELRPIWNELAPVIKHVLTQPAVWAGCRSLRLGGTSLGIRPGSGLLLRATGARAWLVIVDTVLVDRTLGCTLVTWRDGVPPFDAKSPLTITAVTQFERTAGLFGRTAMAWQDIDDKRKQAIGIRAGGVMPIDLRGLTPNPATSGRALWARPVNATPPPANIQALLGLDGDGLLAGTDRGLFRSTNAGATWHSLTLPQPHGWHDILSLHRDEKDALYAGTAAGIVLTSGDGGNGWAMMTQTVIPLADGTQERIARWLRIFASLRRKPEPPAPWTLLSPIRALVTQSSGASAAPNIYIGTDQGVFAMFGNTPGWQPLALSGIPVTALALFVVTGTNKTKLLVATKAGLFSVPLAASNPAGPVRPGLVLKNVECTSVLVFGSDRLIVGTSAGCLLLKRNSDNWEPFNDGFGLAPPPVRSLVNFAGSVCAVTGTGLYTRDIAGPVAAYAPAWQPLDTQALTLFEMDGVFAAGLDAGKILPALIERFGRFGIKLETDLLVRKIFLPVSTFGEKAGWELFEAGQPRLPIFRIYAGAPLRVTRLVKNEPGLGDRLAVTGNSALVASLPLGPVLNDQWPGFAIPTGETAGDFEIKGAELFLDRRIEGIEDRSSLVLAPTGKSLTVDPEVRAVIDSEAILHKAFGKQGIVSRVVVEPTAELLAADLRTTSIYLVSRPLTPFTAINASHEPIGGMTLTLPGNHGDLARGRSLEVCGPRPVAAILERRPVCPIVLLQNQVACAGAEAAPALDQQMIAPELKDAFVAAGIRLSPGVAVSVVSAGATWLVQDGDQVWKLKLPDSSGEALPLGIYETTLYEAIARKSHEGEANHKLETWTLQRGDEVLILTEPEGAIPWQRAASTQPILSEIATIASIAIDHEANVTRVTLMAPLKFLYDSTLCRVCANVVDMTQGTTVTGEVLGSGQAAQPGQSYTLHHSPVTWTREKADYGVHCELEVRVNGNGDRALRFDGGSAPEEPPGEIWNQIRSLALAGPAERVFALTTDDAGRSTLSFGDGMYGARLPSGSNNVTATYRTGAGAQGNLPAGSLIALRKRPAGIRSATNPIPAIGGKDAESSEELRVRAPHKLEGCDRIVTLDDYRTFARGLTGVGHSLAVLIQPGIVSLTLATADWRPISQTPELKKAIRRAIEAHRADQQELRLEDPKVVPFHIELSLAIEPNADSVQIVRRVRAALAEAFGYAARDFGQHVDPREVLDVASAVPGVTSVDLTALHRSGEPLSPIARLAARPAAFATITGRVEPVEWLVINGESGIRIAVNHE